VSRLPVVGAATMARLLLRIGFEPVRQRGSHVFYRHPDGRTTTLPHHRGRDVSRPLIRQILREIGVEPGEYVRLLREL
jgi:predicted RNA binding protein YcfA (HicA-like mRNA interferase family)